MFDAASRLAEGRPAVDAIQDYVWACHLLGYQDPDLTLNASQVRDWYGSEDGMDLQALDADCEALRAAAAAAEGALARQDAQLALMAVAWEGQGAQASRDFLGRHGKASAAAVAAVRTAAESMASLRDRLWHSVDGKVAATIAAQGRGENPEWRAAAQTVTTGAGDRATASELVDQEVKPFVENDIRSEWLGAIRSAMAAVTEAYDAAAAELTSEVGVGFDVPGELGPSWSPDPREDVATVPASVTPVASTVGAASFGAPAPAPSAWSAPPAPPVAAPLPPPLPPPVEPLPPTAPPVDPAAMAPPSVPSMPSMGGGMPDVGSGLSGFGGQLGDLLGGLMGTSQDAVSDLPEPDELEEEPDDLDPLEDEDELEDDDEADETDSEETEPDEAAEASPTTDTALEPLEEPSAEPLSADVEPVSPPTTPAPPPIEPLAAPVPASTTGTPCEIAADELPQVGE